MWLYGAWDTTSPSRSYVVVTLPSSPVTCTQALAHERVLSCIRSNANTTDAKRAPQSRTQTHRHTDTQTHTATDAETRTATDAETHTRTHTHAHAHTHRHTHTHTHRHRHTKRTTYSFAPPRYLCSCLHPLPTPMTSTPSASESSVPPCPTFTSRFCRGCEVSRAPGDDWLPQHTGEGEEGRRRTAAPTPANNRTKKERGRG